MVRVSFSIPPFIECVVCSFDCVAPSWYSKLVRLWRRTILLCLIISGDYSFLLFADGGAFVMKVSSFAVFIINTAGGKGWNLAVPHKDG